MKIKISKIRCKRCNYEWIPRVIEVKMCPRCKTLYWNKSKKNKKKVIDGKPTERKWTY